MTKQNCTAKKSVLQPSVRVGDTFTNNKGCSAIVIKYINNKNVTIRFQDEYGYELTTTAINIVRGSVKNPYNPVVSGVGFFGVGHYKARVGTKDTDEYTTWRHMIVRCYDSREQARFPTYIGCTVDDEWHNFQNFAQWYTNHDFYGRGYHLDKDLLLNNNKVYSPKTCALVPAEINTILNDCRANRGLLPIGVCYNKQSGMYTASIRVNGKKIHLGYYQTVHSASMAYLEKKSNYIKSKAFEWQHGISRDVFISLINTANNLIKK